MQLTGCLVKLSIKRMTSQWEVIMLAKQILCCIHSYFLDKAFMGCADYLSEQP